MKRAIDETDRRRNKQIAYNTANGIRPETIKKNVEDILSGLYSGDVDLNRVTANIDKPASGGNLKSVLKGLRSDMLVAAENLEFEEAARLRDEITRLETVELVVADDPLARQYTVDNAINKTNSLTGRSTVGRPGQRGGVKRRKKRS
jgi:excinuclease ABC subunit B